MARGQSAQPASIVVTVPRHASAVASEDLLAEVKKLAESEGKRFAYDHAGASQTARSKAAAQASEWNSLLVSARAARGPQWDVGIQQYLVDMGSDLYYDPTPLSRTNEPGSPNAQAAEGQDGMDITPGMGPNIMFSNSESSTPITPGPGGDGAGPIIEKRRTRAGGGGY